MEKSGQSLSSQQQAAQTFTGAAGPRFDKRGLPHGYRLREGWELTPRQISAMLKTTTDMVLIDCRTPMEYRIARIHGAKLVPLDELNNRLHELHGHKNQKIVVYCHHGIRSLQACSILRQHGFGDVWSMAGGIDLWSLAMDPSTPRY